ncbi:MAG: DUF1707 domain-containing protein [Spirochaetaceae bacterium]
MSDDKSALPQKYGLPKLRRAALERLARAYADDDLELEDYERRTGEIHAAETVQEVSRVMADVPDFHVDEAGRHGPGKQPFGHPSPHVAVPPPGEEGEHGTAVQILGDRDIALGDFRGGAMNVFCLLGDTRIDLGDLGPRDTVVVTDYGALGDVLVRVPAGAEVIERRIVVLGDFKRGPVRTSGGRRNTRWKLEKGSGGAPRRRVAGPGGKTGNESPTSNALAPRVVLRGFRLLGDTTIIEV